MKDIYSLKKNKMQGGQKAIKFLIKRENLNYFEDERVLGQHSKHLHN